MAYLNRTTKQWQEIDTAHHLHPFTDYKSLAKEGSIIVTKADGVHLTTSMINSCLMPCLACGV